MAKSSVIKIVLLNLPHPNVLQSVLDFVITGPFQNLGYGHQRRIVGRSAAHNFELPSDVFVMLPAPGDGELKVVVQT